MSETVKLILMTVVMSTIPRGLSDSQLWGRGYGRTYSYPWGGVQRYGSYRVAQPEPQPEPSIMSDSRSRRLVSSSQQLNPRVQKLIRTTTKPLKFTTLSKSTPKSTTATPTVRTSITTTKAEEDILPLFDLRDDSDSLFDDVFDNLEKEQETKADLWRIRPGQFEVVAAVPGEPVKSTISRLPKSVPKSIQIQPQFSPVPAVPIQSSEQSDIRSTTQISEQLDSFVDLSDGLSGGNSVLPDISIKKTISSDDDDKKKARKKFRKCQGQCVQQFCLPVQNLDVYAKCVDKCKNICI